MGSGGGPSAKKGAPTGRKNTIHFVNAQPASESERLNNKKLVRAHVGQWISTQTKDRIAASAASLPPVANPPLAISDEKPQLETQAIVEVESDEPYLPSASPSSTFTSDSPPSSRDSPGSSISSASRHVVPIFTTASHPQSELPLAIVPSQAAAPSPTNDIFYQQQFDDEDEGLAADSSESNVLSPPSSGDYIEVVGAGSLDPFRVYPAHIDKELIRLSDDYCAFNLCDSAICVNPC